MLIAGTVAFITGAGSGIGRATALALARAGSRVIVADIDGRGGQETVDRVRAEGGTAVFQRCDTTVTSSLEAGIAAAVAQFGQLDIVHNNAGISREGIYDDDPEAWRRMVDINLVGVIDGTRIALRELRRAGRGGVIINTASMGGLIPMPNNPVYAATKAGVLHFTRSVAAKAIEWNVRVNAICPSYVDTPLVRHDGDARVEELRAEMGGILLPEDVAAGVIELIEDDTQVGSAMRVTVQRGRDYARLR